MHSETIKATVVSLYANGRSFNNIGQELKLTKGQVAGIIFRYRALYGEARDGIGKPLRAGAHQHDVSLSSSISISARKK